MLILKRRFLYRFRNTVFLSWVLCLSLIFIIPVIASGLLYRQSVNFMRNEMDRVYVAELEKLRYIMDANFTEMKRIALELALNKNIVSLYAQGSFGPKERMQLYSLQERLKDYCTTNVAIKEIAVGFLDKDMIISNSSSNSIENYNYQVFSGKFWDEIKAGEQQNRYALLTLRSKPTLAYILSLPLQIGSTHNAVVMILLDTAAIEQIGNSFAGRSLIIHMPGDNIYIGNYEEDDEVLWLDSELSGIRYEYHITKGEYAANIKRINSITILCLMICLLLCGLILFYFLRQNYNPILRIISKLNEGGAINGFRNEFEYIETSLDYTLNEAAKLKLQLDSNSNAMWDLIVSKLITGSLSQHETEAIMEQYDVLRADAYCVIMTRPINYRSLFFANEKENDDYLSLVQYIIKNIIADYKMEGQHVDSITLGGDVISLFCANETKVKSVISQLSELPETIHSLFNAQVCIGVGDIVCDIGEINKSYSKSNEMLQISIVFNKNFTVYSDIHQLKIESMQEVDQFLDITRKFRNMIIAMEFTGAANLLDDMFSVYFNPSQSMDSIRGRMRSINDTFLSSLQQWLPQNPEAILSIEDIESKLKNSTTVQQLKDSIADVLTQLENRYGDFAQQQLLSLMDSVMKYIDENYQRYDINVSSIAEHFNLSNSYFSKIFKKVIGKGVLDYLHEIRIRQAKLFLRDGKYTIGQIAEMVGYNDANAFIRTFKKYEGITPGKF